MSFKRKSPPVLVSAAFGALTGFAIVGGAIMLLALPTEAQAASKFDGSPGHHAETASRFEAGTRTHLEH